MTNRPFYDVDGIRGSCPECGHYVHYWGVIEYPATTVCEKCEAELSVDIVTEVIS